MTIKLPFKGTACHFCAGTDFFRLDTLSPLYAKDTLRIFKALLLRREIYFPIQKIVDSKWCELLAITLLLKGVFSLKLIIFMDCFSFLRNEKAKNGR